MQGDGIVNDHKSLGQHGQAVGDLKTGAIPERRAVGVDPLKVGDRQGFGRTGMDRGQGNLRARVIRRHVFVEGIDLKIIHQCPADQRRCDNHHPDDAPAHAAFGVQPPAWVCK